LSEILTAKYQYVNREFGALVLPDSKTGFKSIPLSCPAMEVIDNLPVITETEYLFPGRKPGSHFVGLNHIWGRLRAKAGLDDVRIHDLRHSFASVGAASGLGLPIIGALLGHLDQSTTQRYSHLQADPLKQATEIIGRKIDEAMKKKPRLLRVVK
jgi:integrase